MSLKEFHSYRRAVQFYFQCEKLKCPEHLKRKLLLASSSIALTLAEAATETEASERDRLYRLALDFFWESQAVFKYLYRVPQSLVELTEQLDESLGHMNMGMSLSGNDGASRDLVPQLEIA